MPAIVATDSVRLASSPADRGPQSTADRIVVAAVACIGRSGVARTTLDDIAREAGCGRATIYRLFPAGKDGVMLAAGRHELIAFFERMHGAVTAADTLEESIVVALTTAFDAITSHEGIQYLVEYEPEVVLPLVAFDGFDRLLGWSARFARLELADTLDPDLAARIGEWVARIVVSFALEPTGPDLGDPAVAQWFVRTFLTPGLASIGVHADGETAPTSQPEPQNAFQE